MLDFEWDEQKALSNLAKHRVSFAVASEVFNDPFAVDTEERSLNYGEVRRRIIGVASGVFLTVIYTERNDIVRIISARRATRAERREYENAT
ncbi:BrnT family toxin [Rhizobium sp. CG5]|uniref:BrnT family toxin n=1 Tax=Rhizobium sp. CG5 TaxID=2726076 RepID=UPI0020338BDE|nr:BrnT family toxin [Rhizobium sp. CG5]MCM2475652.1 BrnT family toxin [Rhizobium sp. CG5]